MTRKMSEIYVAAYRLATLRVDDWYLREHDSCKHMYYAGLLSRIGARLVDRMMARPTRSVADLCKRHGLTLSRRCFRYREGYQTVPINRNPLANKLHAKILERFEKVTYNWNTCGRYLRLPKIANGR